MEKATCSTPSCERALQARGLCATHYSYWYRSHHGRKKDPPKKKAGRTCSYCEAEFVTSQRTTRFCSVSCAVRSRAGWSRSVALEVWTPPPAVRRTFTPTHTSSGRTFVAGACQRCGVNFVVVDQRVARYCSIQCARLDGKDRRRALKRAAFVAPVSRRRIFERDGWRCQICQRKVRRSAVAPHPRAPTLDHIVPLARGGSHEPSNVQLACFLCNCTKGDRGGPEQLRLVG